MRDQQTSSDSVGARGLSLGRAEPRFAAWLQAVALGSAAIAAVFLTLGSTAYAPSSAQALRMTIVLLGLFIAGLAMLAASTELWRLREWRGAAARVMADTEHATDTRWEIEESVARYRDVLDAQGDLIARRNVSGELIFANTAYRELFDLPSSLEATRHFAPVVVRSEAKVLNSEMHKAQRRKVTELVQSPRGERWIAWEEYDLNYQDGSREILKVGRDVTDERRADDALREARDQADAANRAKSRFLASMSHEIRTPMNGILGMSSLLRDTELSADQTSYVRAIDQSARALLALIDEILDFSKIEAGKLKLTEAPFSIAACVQGALELMVPRAKAKGLAIGLGVAADVPAVSVGDETRVRQIVLNLVSNAVKFTDSGRVDVVIYPLRSKQANDQTVTLAIAVRDTGVGLTQEAMRRIFLEFEQVDDIETSKRGGTGLGLAISRRLARAMGGDITVDGAPGKGSTFTAVLKVERFSGELSADVGGRHNFNASQVSGDNGIRALPGHTSAKPFRVLIAEDNEINALLARRVIETAGGFAEVVTNGRAAIAAATAALSASEERFDLILMDVFMPEVDGLEATRTIKATYQAAGSGSVALPPIIALTANAFAEDRAQCIDAGMNDYLAKPFDARDLRVLLNRWVPDKAAPKLKAVPTSKPAA